MVTVVKLLLGSEWLVEHDGKLYEVGNGAILMQSTDLEDTSGDRIYEGDIVKGTSYRYGYELDDGKQFEYIGFIQWFGTEFQRWVVSDADIFNERSGGSWDLSQLVHRNMVDYLTGSVIGNIYQHPELLKQA
ncbi:hypothetical protein C5Y93_05015 [Blastopirellula marina]|uniref:YopX protein domain-containing protein n=2 Tax=Blastopirellula marina TaxID=124 RepID=A0A2S8GSL3_9BACT|nr:hypothetical protein C5Y93_05015 [Blastopirellula marina]